MSRPDASAEKAILLSVAGKKPEYDGITYSIGDVCLVGRSSECNVRLKSKSISSRHALLEYREEKHALSDARTGIRKFFDVTDLNSRNGTFINEERIQNDVARLTFGDVIRFGYDFVSYRVVEPSSLTQHDLQRDKTEVVDPSALPAAGIKTPRESQSHRFIPDHVVLSPIAGERSKKSADEQQRYDEVRPASVRQASGSAAVPALSLREDRETVDRAVSARRHTPEESTRSRRPPSARFQTERENDSSRAHDDKLQKKSAVRPYSAQESGRKGDLDAPHSRGDFEYIEELRLRNRENELKIARLEAKQESALEHELQQVKTALAREQGRSEGERASEEKTNKLKARMEELEGRLNLVRDLASTRRSWHGSAFSDAAEHQEGNDDREREVPELHGREAARKAVRSGHSFGPSPVTRHNPQATLASRDREEGIREDDMNGLETTNRTGMDERDRTRSTSQEGSPQYIEDAERGPDLLDSLHLEDAIPTGIARKLSREVMLAWQKLRLVERERDMLISGEREKRFHESVLEVEFLRQELRSREKHLNDVNTALDRLTDGKETLSGLLAKYQARVNTLEAEVESLAKRSMNARSERELQESRSIQSRFEEQVRILKLREKEREETFESLSEDMRNRVHELNQALVNKVSEADDQKRKAAEYLASQVFEQEEAYVKLIKENENLITERDLLKAELKTASEQRALDVKDGGGSARSQVSGVPSIPLEEHLSRVGSLRESLSALGATLARTEKEAEKFLLGFRLVCSLEGTDPYIDPSSLFSSNAQQQNRAMPPDREDMELENRAVVEGEGEAEVKVEESFVSAEVTEHTLVNVEGSSVENALVESRAAEADVPRMSLSSFQQKEESVSANEEVQGVQEAEREGSEDGVTREKMTEPATSAQQREDAEKGGDEGGEKTEPVKNDEEESAEENVVNERNEPTVPAAIEASEEVTVTEEGQ